jgi:hypothetical protein
LRVVPRPNGRGDAKGSAIANDSFLALVSDQGLRTIVIAGARTGRTRLARLRAGQPMSDQDVTTSSPGWRRVARTAGQPYRAQDSD